MSKAPHNEPNAGSGQDLESVYARFFAQAAEPGGRSFEEFFAEHPERDGELRRLHEGMALTEAALSPVESSIELGYELVELLGAGGDGEVHRALDKALEREVAIKLLKLKDESSSQRRRRFLDEARAMAKVRHENVVRIQTVDERGGEIRLVMELIEGRTLKRIVEEDGPLSAQEAARIGVDVCRALGALHQAHLVHLDVKPGNVMRERGGRTVLLDFGLVRSPSPEEQHLGGTPPFMAPEHFGRGLPGPTTDVYGLGATLYWLVSGAYPVDGENVQEIRAGIIEGRVRPLLDLVPDLPPHFVGLVERAMSPEPAARHASMGFLERELRAYLAEEQPEAPASGVPRRALVLGAVAGLALASSLVYWIPGARAAEPLVLHAALTLHPKGGEDQSVTEATRVRVGDAISLQVEADEPFYLYLFNEDEQGLCYTLYPEDQEHRMLPPREPLHLPRDLGRWNVTTAGGTEHLFLIASRERDALGEWLRARVPRPEQVAPEFSVSALPRGDLSQLRSVSRGFGSETRDVPEKSAELVDFSLADAFAIREREAAKESGVLVLRWGLPHSE